MTVLIINVVECIGPSHSLLRPFLCFTTNQFAQKFEFLANLITYFVKMCNILSKS